MIAATAIVAGATLITMNAQDFRGIDGLRLEAWPSPV
jgi:predicted nucleic acid-binding protein